MLTKKDFKLGNRLYRADNGSIYVRVKIGGVEYRRATKTCDERVASIRAAEIVRKLTSRKDTAIPAPLPTPTLPERKTRGNIPTIAQTINAYLEGISAASGGNCSPRTAKNNTLALKRIIGASLDINASVARINADTLLTWRANRYAQHGLNIAATQDLALNYTLNSDHNSARAVFSSRARQLYAKLGLVIPTTVDDFCTAPKLPEKSTRFAPIPPEIDAQIRALCTLAIDRAIRKPSSRETYAAAAAPLADAKIPAPDIAVAVELARYVGLTASEISAVAWNWIETRKNGTFVCIQPRPACAGKPAFVAKNNAKYGDIAISPTAVERWRQTLRTNSPFAYIIPATSGTDRRNRIYRAANKWLAKFLPDRTKRLHELRKQAGSDVAERTGSIKRAADFLRDSVATAEKHYASMLTPTPSLY